MRENNELWRMPVFYVITPPEMMEQESINMKQLADVLRTTESNLRKKLDPNNNILIKSLAQVYGGLHHTLLVFPLDNKLFDQEALMNYSKRYGDSRVIHPNNLLSIFTEQLLKNISHKRQMDFFATTFILSIAPTIKYALDNGLEEEVIEQFDHFIQNLTNAITSKLQNYTQQYDHG